MEAKYQQWRSTYIRQSAQGAYCFYNGKGDNGDAITCSEAHGYAMLISVLHKNQQEFDNLLRFFLAFRNSKGLMKWQIRQSQQRGIYTEEDGETCATDGDIDIATSLFLASRYFPQGGPVFPAGAYSYEGAALADSLMKFCIHPTLRTPLLGDWCNTDSKEGVRLYNSVRSSDLILSGFLLFHRAHPNPEERRKWQEVLEASISVALSQINSPTGLLPDFLEFSQSKGWSPAKGRLLESDKDGDMNWNACRTPWRLAHYYMVTRDQRLLPLLQKMHRSLTGLRAFPSVPAGIRLKDGKALADYSDRAFIAPAGLLCHSIGDSNGHMACVKALEEEEPAYFGDSIDICLAEQADSPNSVWL